MKYVKNKNKIRQFETILSLNKTTELSASSLRACSFGMVLKKHHFCFLCGLKGKYTVKGKAQSSRKAPGKEEHMNRYSQIREKNPREILLLRGSGCKWRKCRFCDYHLDFSKDESANFQLNARELCKITGTFGVLEVINSGSFCDLDENTVKEILSVCRKKHVGQLHIECHWRDRHTLSDIRKRFQAAGIRIIVKMGAETFDAPYREEVLCKGMDYALPEEIAQYAEEVCLLFGLSGQSESTMKRDIETGLQNFQRVCVNLMTENSSSMKPDKRVQECFMKALYPQYRENERVDLLLENTGFGVGGAGHE